MQREAMRTSITLATGPVSWGVDFADAPGNPPWRQVLDEIQRAGLTAMELGPLGYLPEDSATIRSELANREIRAAGSFVFQDLHDPSQSEEITAITERTCRLIAGAGGELLVIIDRPGPERVATAGRPADARRLDAGAWTSMLDMVERLGDVAHRYAIRPVVHPHAGSYIEFEDEIDRLLTDCELGLCLDTGHAAYAGMTAHDALLTYGSRLQHVHLKDINAEVLERVQAQQLDFWRAIAADIFCPLGSGVVELPKIAAALEAIGYGGFATIEQDRVPGSGSPLDDLVACVDALRQAGIGTNSTTNVSTQLL